MAGSAISQISNEERDELQAVLKAKALARSPSVLRIAEYIVMKCLQGEADGLKEYNIAVEALGKPAAFDPKRDSIVRVEAHRLRKKLAEFYRTEGAGHALRIVIDPGQYIPRVEPNIGTPPVADEAIPTPQRIAPEAPAVLEPVPLRQAPLREEKRSRFDLRWLAAAALAVAGLGVAAWYAVDFQSRPDPDAIRLIGGSARSLMVASPLGPKWLGDRWFSGGSEALGTEPLAGIPEVPVTAQRQGNFNYDIPLVDTPYELRLYFGPRLVSGGSPGNIAHGFDVLANGVKLLDALDPSPAPEHSVHPIIRVFHDIRPARDGRLHLAFRNGADTAYVNAIELTPGEAGRLMPIRIVAKTAPYTEPNGRTWSADRYVTGGTLTIRMDRIPGTADRNLMSGERYGTFTYEIPVAKGSYSLKLYFAETWFGPHLSGGGAGSRRFDVFANGTPLLWDFDIFREAGLRNGTVVRSFPGLSPNADGYINLSFMPRVNNACVNALELIDEAR